MHFTAATLALLFYLPAVLAVTCGPGTFKPTGSSTSCNYCTPGTWNNQNSPPTGNCNAAQSGYYACGPQTVNGSPCYGATTQDNCGQGKYSSTSGNSACTICPAGTTCGGQNNNNPQKCSKGQYSNAGSTTSSCPNCPVGTYSFVNGATRCCNCCAGTYNDQTGQTHCYYCGEHTNPKIYYSPVGATSVNQCQANPIAGTTNAPENTCKNTPAEPSGGAKAYCPAEQGNSSPNPNPSAVNKKRRDIQCARGYTRCPVFSGRGGFDCIDVMTNTESCGGCVDPSAPSNALQGQDCNAIPHVSTAACKASKCVIKSCQKGYELNAPGTACHLKRITYSTGKRRWQKNHGQAAFSPRFAM